MYLYSYENLLKKASTVSKANNAAPMAAHRISGARRSVRKAFGFLFGMVKLLSDSVSNQFVDPLFPSVFFLIAL